MQTQRLKHWRVFAFSAFGRKFKLPALRVVVDSDQGNLVLIPPARHRKLRRVPAKSGQAGRVAGGGVVAETCLARPPHSAWQEGGRSTGSAGALTWMLGRRHNRKLSPISGI